MIPADIAHYSIHTIFVAVVGWLWKERGVLKDVLEEKLERRHTMINPITIVQDVNLAVAAVEKLKASVPLISKTVADIKQCVADKGDTTKLDADLAALLTDVNSDLSAIASLFPTTQAAVPVV